MNSLFVGLIAGVFGMAYFVYGKKRAKLSAMLAVGSLLAGDYIACAIGLLRWRIRVLNRSAT